MLEKLLIMHCSPTLAGIKTANLFNFKFTLDDDLISLISDENGKLNWKGVYVEVLRIEENSALILTYRPKKLAADLKKPRVSELLKQFGYTNVSIEYAISKLKERLGKEHAFPHEIGLFLGYPLCDVVGFIENTGKNSKHTGFWKVYNSEVETVKLFAKYKKCTDIYSKLFKNGYSFMRLIVAT